MKNNIRVAFIGETTYPSNNIKWINNLVENFDVEGIVIVRSNQNFDHINSSVKVYRCLRSFPFFDLYSLFVFVRQIRRIIKSERIDIVHFLWGANDPCLGPLLAMPFVITTHGSDILRDLRNHYLYPNYKPSIRNYADLVKRYFHLIAYRRAKVVTSASFGQKEVLRIFQPKITKNIVVRSAINPHELKIRETEDFEFDEVLQIFSPRTMRPIYNQDLIVKAVRILKDKGFKLKLRMVDNMPFSDWSNQIKSLIEKLDVDDMIELLPSQSSEMMNEEYYKAHIVIMLPKSDGVPVSGIESMIIGTPLLIGANKYDEDVFDKKWLWQLEENTPEEISNAIESIRNCKLNEVRLKLRLAQKIGFEKGDMKNEMRQVYSQYISIQNSYE